MMQKIFLGIIGLLVVVGIITYLTRGAASTENNTPVNTAQPQTDATPDSGAVQTTSAVTTQDTGAAPKDVLTVTIRGTNYTFSQNTITAKQGQTVRVTFVSDSGVHNFVIDEISGAKTKQLRAGDSETVEFVADKKGTFKYFCSVGNHRESGMEGTLTVE